ncbi:MAG: hypothetical protein CUR34_12985 [Sediminibacterium sp.]|nr:MAG: hypothetical protein CUR34_12985 [Sediminibacterium sp.] [Sediminibacterium sp. FEMGT703S]
MNINIKELVSNHFFCPFNIDSYNYLYGCKEGKILLYKLNLLYDKIYYSFSSPGNSFQRNIIYELNRQFNYGSPVDGSLFNSISDNIILLERYKSIFEGLYNLLTKHQFRQLDEIKLEKLKSAVDITITSDWLTIDGLSRTLGTFENIQDEVRDRIKLETKNG